MVDIIILFGLTNFNPISIATLQARDGDIVISDLDSMKRNNKNCNVDITIFVHD